MLNTTQMSVKEIRNHIVETYNIDKKEVDNIVGKSNLVNFLYSLKKVEDNNMLPMDGPNSAIEEDLGFEIKLKPEEKQQVDENKKPPSIFEPEWTEYVLSQLTDKEIDKGYPKADGLRRLVEKLIGPISSIETHVIQAPHKDNFMTATVKTKVGVNYSRNWQNPMIVYYEACTDVQKEHLPSPYDKHISAVAETRAEGRAYRKILRLQNVVTKEEMVSDTDHDDAERMNDTQMKFLETMCKNDRLNINIKKLFHLVFKDQKLENVKAYKYNQVLELTSILSGYQDDTSQIPVEIRGYDSSWRD